MKLKKFQNSTAFSLMAIVIFPFLSFVMSQDDFVCQNSCKLDIVETIPEGMEPIIEHLTTHKSWVQLIEMAQESIEIASYYWTLRDEDSPFPPHPTSNNGTDIIERLLEAGSRPENKIQIRIVNNEDDSSFPNSDLKELVDANAAEVRFVNFTHLIGAGVLHTKMWIVDRKHVYLGSANLDWRALTQVKEIGVMATNCSCIGADMAKTFDVYWKLGEENAELPDTWDPSYESPYNEQSPMQVNSDGVAYDAFVSSAPPKFCPTGRTSDLDAIFHVMNTAEEFIHIAVMDYFPLIMFDGPLQYWGELDNYLRDAALRGIKVKLLMAKWTNTRASAEMFLKSLDKLKGAYANVDIQVKMFQVPADDDQAQIPYSRVNHNKYVVTDKATHIGTSNWSGDYFVSSGGVGFVAIPKNSSSTQKDIRTQVQEIFDRDWNSVYTKSLEEVYPEDICPIPTTETSETSPESSTKENVSSQITLSLYLMLIVLFLNFTILA